MAYSQWKGLKGLNYVVHRKKDDQFQIVKVTKWTEDGVEFILSLPVPERYEYSNASRYWLAKKGVYPMTKTGEAQLQAALEEIPIENNYLKQWKAAKAEEDAKDTMIQVWCVNCQKDVTVRNYDYPCPYCREIGYLVKKLNVSEQAKI